MTLQEIIDLTRRRLGNYELPCNWTDQELVDYCNYAIGQISRNAYLFEDAYTPAICNITTVADQIDYLLSTDIVELRNIRVTGESSAITQTGTGLNDLSICGSYTHDNTDTVYLINVTTASTTDVFKWSDDSGVTYTSSVSMTADWQELSHGVFIKFTAKTGHTATDTFTFTVSDNSNQLMTLTSVKEMYNVIPSWRMSTSDIPIKYLLDYRRGYISFYPPPDDVYLINMNVLRYPATDMTITSMSGQTPEIPAVWHMILVDGILYQAYNKTGIETYNERKADRHYGMFRLGINDINRSKIINVSNKQGMTPHEGNI
uniref:Putative structural protein n=1 Tax=viral metagenome TaxID=1070528 RepID=A0A6H1ZYG9_9ZZZZ